MEKNYIIPTKQRPVFQVWNTYAGYVVTDCRTYMEWEIKSDACHVVGETTAIDLPGAMEALFSHIKLNFGMTKSAFAIEMLDGTMDKNGEPKRTRIFTISMSQALEYGLYGELEDLHEQDRPRKPETLHYSKPALSFTEPDIADDARVSIGKAAQLLGIHRSTLLSHTNNGYIKCIFHRVNKRRLYLGKEIKRYWKSHS